MRRMIVLGFVLLGVAHDVFAAEYFPKKGDTVGGLCRRLGHSLHQLQAMNPWITRFASTDELAGYEKILHVTPGEEALAVKQLEKSGFFKQLEKEQEEEFARAEEKAKTSARKNNEPYTPPSKPDPVPPERRFSTCYSLSCSVQSPGWVHFTEVLRLAQLQMEEAPKIPELPTRAVAMNVLIVLPTDK